MWYPCQNQSGMANYEQCRSHYPVQPGVRPHIRDVVFNNVRGADAWRSVWANCLPESPCKNIDFGGFEVGGGTLPMVTENVHRTLGSNKAS